MYGAQMSYKATEQLSQLLCKGHPMPFGSTVIPKGYKYGAAVRVASMGCNGVAVLTCIKSVSTEASDLKACRTERNMFALST